MTNKEIKFAEYYIACGNAVQSAINAGYPRRTAEYASNWLNPKKPKKFKPELAEYIRQLTKEKQEERIMNAMERQIMLSDIAQNKSNEPADRIRAIETLNKMTGEYITKVEAKVESSQKLSDIMAQLGGEGLEE